MKKYKLTYVNIFRQDKEGKPYMTKNGKPFVRVSVKAEEYGNEYISGIWFGADCPWGIGQEVEFIIKEEIYKGKKQLNFELPPKENPNQKNFEEITTKVTKIGLGIDELLTWKRTQTGELKK